VPTKVISLRLDQQLATEMATLARTQGVSMSEAIRAAAYRYIAECRADPVFKKQAKERLEEDTTNLRHFLD
jgi:metal-responsive CopG/Arc/MetJ family transcriptional regulator